MSNVLIGIIGVILFIGLALAGALFLGPRFQQSVNNSKASAVVQGMAQVAGAADMYRLQEGSVAVTGTLDAELVGKGYLKSRPAGVGLDTNSGAGAGNAAELAYYTFPDATAAPAICAAINRQAGGSDVVPEGTVPSAASTVGCMKLTAPWGAMTAGSYLAFARI